jgi:hypothetical protein
MYDRMPDDILGVAKAAILVSESKRSAIRPVVSLMYSEVAAKPAPAALGPPAVKPSFVAACNAPHDCRYHPVSGTPPGTLCLNRLIIHGVDSGDDYDEVKSIATDAEIAYSEKHSVIQLVFATHDDATACQQKLQNAGYRVNFMVLERDPQLCPKTERFYWHACSNAECKCRHYMAKRDVRKPRPVINTLRLNITNLPKGKHWDWNTIRSDIMDQAGVKEAKTTHVKENKRFAYIILLNHEDAVLAQQNLERADYMVSFAPVHEKK